MGTKPRFGQIGFYDTRPNGPSRVNLKVLGKKFKNYVEDVSNKSQNGERARTRQW